MNQTSDDVAKKNRRTARLLALVVVGMFGFGFALVPLYNLICDVVGIQSITTADSTRRREDTPVGGGDFTRTLVLKFDATVHPDLPWDFEPVQRRMEVHPGVVYEMAYDARNRSDLVITAQAIPSVVPWQATPYFSKLECFCFNEQTLEGRQQARMPLRFMVAADLPRDIDSLTLSYSFMHLHQVESGPDMKHGADHASVDTPDRRISINKSDLTTLKRI